jgi:hypothetical protein
MPDIRTLGLEQCVCAALLRQTLNQIPEKRAYKAHAACGHSGNPEPYAAAIDNQGPDTSGIGRLAKSCAENRTPDALPPHGRHSVPRRYGHPSGRTRDFWTFSKTIS